MNSYSFQTVHYPAYLHSCTGRLGVGSFQVTITTYFLPNFSIFSPGGVRLSHQNTWLASSTMSNFLLRMRCNTLVSMSTCRWKCSIALVSYLERANGRPTKSCKGCVMTSPSSQSPTITITLTISRTLGGKLHAIG